MAFDIEILSRVGPYAERLAANEYLQENLRDAAANLRDAYARASKKKAAAAEDKVFYRRLRQAAGSLSEARGALLSGRKKPKRSKKRVILLVVAGAGAAGAVALASNEDLRRGVLARGAGALDSESPPLSENPEVPGSA